MGDQPPRARQNPYVGLVPFGQDDVAWFFGRDREQEIIGANLRSSRLTLLYGASGVGKSSVLHAAVIPGLRAVLEQDRATRDLDDADMRDPVRFAVATFSAWRDAPLEGLMAAVAASVAEATGEPVAAWTPGTALRQTFAGWLRSVSSLLIVLDQFEEYFLYHPHDDGPGTFAGELVDVLNDDDLRVNVLLSLREDELAKLDRFQGRVPGLFDNYLRVEHLDLDAAGEAVHGPLEESNRHLPEGAPPATIEPELVDEILREVRSGSAVTDDPRGPAQESPSRAASATDRVETPLLQLVMQRLWHAAAEGGGAPHLRLATLRDELGGTENIVNRHLEDALDALPDDDRDLAVDVLRPLVSPTGTKIAWRAADLAYWARRPPEAVEPMLRELARGERRILRPVMPPASQADQAPRYEIFHDILAAPILDWCERREDERERAELERELEAQATVRAEAEREARRRRRRRFWAAGALVLVAVSLGAARLALERSELDDSRALAASAVGQLPLDPERSLLLATRAVERHDTGEAVQALRLSLGSSRVRAVLDEGRPRPCSDCTGLATATRSRFGTVLSRVAIAPDGRTVATISRGRARLWQPRTGATFKPSVDTGEVLGVAFTPDARRLLVVGDKAAALAAPDGTRGVPITGTFQWAAIAPDSRHLVTVGRGGAVVVRTVSDGDPVARLASVRSFRATFTSSDRIVVQRDNGDLLAWRWRTGRTRLLAPGEGAINLEVAPGPGLAVDSGANGKARVVTAGGTRTPLPPGSNVEPLEFAYISPDGSRVATVSGARVELWRSNRTWTAPARRVASLPHDDSVTEVTFSGDSQLVATASSDGIARVWESSTGGLVAELAGHSGAVGPLTFNSDGRYLVTTSDDLTVRLWDLGDERTLRLPMRAEAVASSGPGSHLVAEDRGTLKVWDPRARASTAAVRRIAAPDAGSGVDAIGALHPTSVAVAGNDRVALAGFASADRYTTGGAALMDLSSGRTRLDVVRDLPVAHVAVDRAARTAAIVRETDGGTRADLWDLRGARRARRIWRVPIVDAEQVTDVAFSPDGRRLLATTIFGAARIFDVARRSQALALAPGTEADPGPEAFYRGVFSPDGSTVAVAAAREARMWDARTGAERGFRLTGHTGPIRSVAYDAAGRRVVTASADATVRVWDARDGTQLAVLRRHAGGVNDAAFLPDGRIVSAGDDRAVRIYPCITCRTVDALLGDARRLVTRPLSDAELAEYAGG